MITGLHRTLIKWLDSLDLTYTVRNLKRDFSNGFLIAEICSRYHPEDFDPIAFSTSGKEALKFDNWNQIAIKMAKHGLVLQKEDYIDIIHCVDGAAARFIPRLYQVLEKREPPPPAVSLNEPNELPLYGQPTASSAIKDIQLTRIQDKNTRAKKTKEAIFRHYLQDREIKSKISKGAPYLLLSLNSS